MTKCRLTSDSGAIAVSAPYDPGFVAELKMKVQPSERRWKGESKSWLVSPRHGKTIQDLCMKYYNEMPLLPTFASVKSVTQQKIIDCRYIGTTKERGSDERSAYGWINGGWNVVFPETVLRAWFDAPATPDEMPTLYSVLAVGRNSTMDEIKIAWRRMVRQWHPDTCREPNAHEQFIAIQRAYEILIHPDKRERYDAGLAFEASLKNTSKLEYGYFNKNGFYVSNSDGYRSPLRCGLIMCEGIESMGVFQVSKIFAWEDVIDSSGRVLVVSWKKGDDKFTEVWA